MITQWSKYMFKINEFYDRSIINDGYKRADIHAYFQQPAPVKTKKRFAIHRRALHLCIDLRKSEEALMKEMSKKTSYKIRRALRDDVVVSYVCHPDVHAVKEFARFYDAFAEAKGIESCKQEKLMALIEKDMLTITYVKYLDGRTLAASVTITNKNTAIGLFNASGRFLHQDISGQVISRANRYLHWCEILHFKNLGYETFNMMGLTLDKENTDMSKISEFKRSFGGEDRVIYQSFIPQTFLGITLIWLLKYLWRNNPEVMKNEQLTTMEYPKERNSRI